VERIYDMLHEMYIAWNKDIKVIINLVDM
jgi:hypothetical protein